MTLVRFYYRLLLLGPDSSYYAYVRDMDDGRFILAGWKRFWKGEPVKYKVFPARYKQRVDWLPQVCFMKDGVRVRTLYTDNYHMARLWKTWFENRKAFRKPRWEVRFEDPAQEVPF